MTIIDLVYRPPPLIKCLHHRYTQFLESELASSHRKQKAAERRLKQTQRMATLAEQQWTEAASYNSTMANERNVAQEDAARSKKWKPTAEARW